MTRADVVFGVATIVATVGFVVLVAGLCWLVADRTVDRPAHSSTEDPRPVPYRIVRRPFDWKAHPDL